MDSALTIVEVTGRLGIGGVETHVCSLATGLIERGHRVILLTRDTGVYGDRAEAAGAELLIVPFDRAGLERAADELAQYRVDIVHAHNYRAARFGAPLARRLRRPYLMTVHGPRAWWKRAWFREWSDTVLTVSEADRDGIAGRFGIPRNRIIVGYLGVDTGRFRSGLDDASALRAEWEVAETQPLILNLTRFTQRKARPALALIQAMPLVRRHVPGTTLVLVGEGGALERIGAAANRLNRATGDRAVVIAGPRTDIPAVLNAGDVIVAAATTATESLACAAPTIAFGRTGYFGIVTPDNFESARALCFADHGRLPTEPGPDRLAADLTSLLTDLPAARRAAAAVRALIEESYSVEMMVVHIEEVYRRVIADHLTRAHSG